MFIPVKKECEVCVLMSVICEALLYIDCHGNSRFTHLLLRCSQSPQRRRSRWRHQTELLQHQTEQNHHCRIPSQL